MKDIISDAIMDPEQIAVDWIGRCTSPRIHPPEIFMSMSSCLRMAVQVYAIK